MSAQASSDNIDLRAILQKLGQKWWLFLITVSVSGALAFAYIKTTPKGYNVQAAMRMSEGKRATYGGHQEEFLKGTGYLQVEGELEDEIGILTSATNTIRTLQRLDFGISYYERKNFLTQNRYDYPPFRVKLDSVALQICGIPVHVQVDTVKHTYRVRVKGKNVNLYNLQQEKVMDEYVQAVDIDQTVPIGKPFAADKLSFSISFPEDRQYGRKSDYFFVINSLEGLVNEWRMKTTAEPISEESNIVVLSTSGEVVNQQVNYLNKLMETYVQGQLFKQQEKGRRTISFIDDKLGTVGDSLKEAQNDIRSIRQKGVFDVGQVSESILTEKSKLQDESALWAQKRSYCERILQKLQSSEDYRNVPAPSASGIDDPQLNNQINELVRLSNDLAAQSLTTVRTNPVIISLERRIRNLQGTVIASAQGLIQQADGALQGINTRLNGLGAQVGNLAYNEAALTSKERDFKISGDLYNYLMEKKYEAGIAIASDQVDKTVVDSARRSGTGPVSPDKKVVFGAAMVLGLLLPLLFILVRDSFNDRITGTDELKRLSAIPLLATVPTSKRKRVLPEEPKSLLAESFRTARINLQYLNADHARQVVGLTSSTSGEGKTFCALNLATVMAMSSKRTLLIDADMRRPKVQEYLGLPDGPGLSMYLIGEATLEQVTRPSDITGLDVITAGPVPPNPLELVESPRMTQLFEQVRNRYDNIIVDASPMGLVSEFKIIIRHLDVTLYVVRRGHTRRSMLRGVNDMFRSGALPHVDLLLNDVKAGDGYGDGYGYYTK